MNLLKKEITRVVDRLSVAGGRKTPHKKGGLLSKDGNPVDPRIIADAFQVPLEQAEEISRRLSL